MSMTIEEFRKISGISSGQKNKYGAKRVGGHASKKEHRRAGELKLKQHAGLISGLREQVSFELIPAHRGADGKVDEHACHYIADFVYVDNASGETIVEDTKGVRTRDYVIKRKLMLAVHGIRIREI